MGLAGASSRGTGSVMQILLPSKRGSRDLCTTQVHILFIITHTHCEYISQNIGAVPTVYVFSSDL